ncbi:MAG TPA: DNA alkylation repair protein [Thermoplasmata archaeon]|nr:DNA alkylation repair protein [Thermoplasmata archaeon]
MPLAEVPGCVGLNVRVERKRLVNELRRRARPSKGDAQAYLGSPVPVLGVSVPDLRELNSAFRKDHRNLESDDLNSLAAALWSGPTFEEKAVAVELLNGYAKRLNEASWRLLDSWVDEASGWGLCDWIGLGPVTKMVSAKPARFRALMRWTKSRNLWRRRIAVYGLRDLVFAGELDKPFLLLERLLYDEEFWVQRAVGTWLRECWKKDRKRTEAFLRTHVRGLPKVVITVATERAPKSFREELRRNR